MRNIIKMNKIKPDNILSLKLPKSDFVFTRYLYIKDEVQIALLLSILNNYRQVWSRHSTPESRLQTKYIL